MATRRRQVTLTGMPPRISRAAGLQARTRGVHFTTRMGGDLSEKLAVSSCAAGNGAVVLPFVTTGDRFTLSGVGTPWLVTKA